MEGEKVRYSVLKDTPASAWETLAKKKIYFGHHSVGFNIVDGIQVLMKENLKIRLNIIKTSSSKDFQSPVFAHSSIGENRNPNSKINSFLEFMNSGIGEQADIAFFKFCFVDFSNKTDINQVVKNYTDTMSKLKKKYPKTSFVHVTSPLVSRETGIKPFIKKIIGRHVRTGEDNLYRMIFNDHLRKTYLGKEPIFDLAKIESTLPDGARSVIEIDGKKILQLAPEYTDDGGHLNKIGRRIVAEQLLVFLTNNIN